MKVFFLNERERHVFSAPRGSWQLCSRAHLKCADKHFGCNQLCHETISTSSSLHWPLSLSTCRTYGFADTSLLPCVLCIQSTTLFSKEDQWIHKSPGFFGVDSWPSPRIWPACTVHGSHGVGSSRWTPSLESRHTLLWAESNPSCKVYGLWLSRSAIGRYVSERFQS